MALAMTGTMATAAHATPSKASLEAQITTASNNLENITEAYNKINIQLAQTTTAENQLQASLQPAKAALAAASGKLGDVIQRQYEEGRVGPLTALLTGGTTNDLIDRLGYLDEISRINQDAVAGYTTTTKTFTQRKAALDTTLAKQTQQKNEINASKKTILGQLASLNKLRKEAYGSSTETGVAGSAGPAPAISGSAGIAVDFVYKEANIPAYYGWGDAGPDKFDCSGLVMAAWAKAGKSLPHNAAEQYHATARISKSQLEPGDLVFYRDLAHVGMYVGGGYIIDAPQTGEPIKKQSVDVMPPYGYGRVR